MMSEKQEAAAGVTPGSATLFQADASRSRGFEMRQQVSPSVSCLIHDAAEQT